MNPFQPKPYNKPPLGTYLLLVLKKKIPLRIMSPIKTKYYQKTRNIRHQNKNNTKKTSAKISKKSSINRIFHIGIEKEIMEVDS